MTQEERTNRLNDIMFDNSLDPGNPNVMTRSTSLTGPIKYTENKVAPPITRATSSVDKLDDWAKYSDRPEVQEAQEFINKKHFSEVGGGLFSLGIGALVDSVKFGQNLQDFSHRMSTLKSYMRSSRVNNIGTSMSSAKDANAMKFIDNSYGQETTNQNEYIGATLAGSLSRSIGREFSKTQDIPQKIVDSLKVPEFRQSMMSAMIQNTRSIATQKTNLQSLISKIVAREN